MKLVSLFTGGGSLDIGFRQAGFEIIWANEFDPKIWETYQANHPDTILDKRNLLNIKSDEIPDADGFIGGPPCQSWAASGSNRGFDDPRGQIFMEYLRVIKDKNPKFFLIENVEGILRRTHRESFQIILDSLSDLNYQIYYQLLNAVDYEVPQDRKRVIIIGIRQDLGLPFNFPEIIEPAKTLRDAIWDLREVAQVYQKNDPEVMDYHYLGGDWSSQFMSRNRVRNWDQPSYTIPASGRHVPVHPQALPMIKIDANHFEFVEGSVNRRFTLRECARIQTLPDDYILKIKNISDGYLIIGNAVPVKLAYHLARSILDSFANT